MESNESQGDNRPKNKTDETLVFRIPTVDDGQLLYKLAKESGGLDVNSEYAYLLLGTHFSKTCTIMEKDSRPLGFVSAYLLQNYPDTLFIWQIAVDQKYKKRGLAKTMIKSILDRSFGQTIRYLQASVTPSNIASQNLFKSLSRDLGTELKRYPLFDKDMFSESHEEEFLVQIGPIFKSIHSNN